MNRKNVAPVIDGIALQDPGVRAQGQPNLATGAAPTAVLKFPPAPTPGGAGGTVIVSQTQKSCRKIRDAAAKERSRRDINQLCGRRTTTMKTS